jgi:hypothetical protein
MDSLLPGIAGGTAAMLTISFLLATRRGEAERAGDAHVIRYGPAWRALTLILAPTPIGVGVFAFVVPPKPDEVWIPWVMAGGFLALIAPLVIEVFGVGHRLTDEGIERVTPWSKRVFVRWQDVTSVRLNPVMSWFVVTGREGARVRLSFYLSGIGTFTRMVLENVAPEAYAGNTLTRRQLEMLAS